MTGKKADLYVERSARRFAPKTVLVGSAPKADELVTD
jgi:hypothetical protein